MTERSTEPSFDPKKHLTKIRIKDREIDYLGVRWRLAWFRADHPNGRIWTELVEHEPGQRAVFRAKAEIPNGGSATAYGSEYAPEFPDYLEKAETKAVGRALAALGYGTEFALDYADAETDPAPSTSRTKQPVPPSAQQPSPPAPTSSTPARAAHAEKVYEIIQAGCEKHGVPLSWAMDWLRAQGITDLADVRRFHLEALSEEVKREAVRRRLLSRSSKTVA